MRLRIGDGITFSAELFRTRHNTYNRLEKEQHGYILQIINDELVYVWNGIRICLVYKRDILINHNEA